MPRFDRRECVIERFVRSHDRLDLPDVRDERRVRVDGAPAPAESRVLRGDDGEPTGIVREGFDLFPHPAPTVEWLMEELPGVTRSLFVSHGVTTICELPSVTSVPHDASGACTPSPRNDRNASVNITCGNASVA